MDDKPQRRDLRKHFEAILGYEIGEIEDRVFALRSRTAIWSKELDSAHLTSREFGTTGDSTKACFKLPVLSISGLTLTGSDGKAEFLLSEYYCLPAVGAGEPPESPTSPIIFVATAQSRDPVFVTTLVSEVSAPGVTTDVRVEIFTWKPNGSPAGSKLVKWFCQFPFNFGTI